MSARPKAVFLDFGTLGPGIEISELEALLDLTCFEYTDRDDVAGRIADARIVIVNKTRLTAAHIESAQNLELVVLAATGTDNVDLAAATARGIAVANIRDYCSLAVAQHVFGLILALNQGIVGYDRLSRAGQWSRSRSFALFDYPIRELRGRSLGIVGYGALGRAVADIARGFGMDVLISARPGNDAPAPEGRIAFDRLIADADILSLHCPLTAATRHMLGAEQFRRMQPHAIVINTARGSLIDPVALADALRTGRIGGAGIDVLAEEPPPADHPLLDPDIPNLLVTPHVAWAALESRQRAVSQLAENVRSYLAGNGTRRVN